MIEITHTDHCISVNGHANYAPHGKDIVCASVSCLIQVFIASVEQLTTDKLKCEIGAGNAVIEYGNLSEQAKTLLSSFLLGLEMIVESYPDHVQISTSFD